MKHLLWTFLITWLLTGAVSAAPLTIVEDGQPRAVIVVAANEPKADEAAAELQKYVEKMSGANLPIIKEGQAGGDQSRVQILVGHTAAAQQLGVKVPAGFDPSIRPDSFEEEGYVLRTEGNQVVVGGNSDGPYLGTLFAAYALLERLGCRWYFPGDWGEVVPGQKTVTVPELNIESRPDFPVRGVWLSGWVPVTADEYRVYGEWSARIGFSAGHPGSEMYPLCGDGFLGGLLPPAEYAEQHPEYYAVNKQGQRVVTPKSDSYWSMLCLSNPEVFTASVARLRDVFASGKTAPSVSQNGFGISPPDGAPFCYCTNCLAGSQNFNYPTYVHERMQSEEFFGFAARLAQAFPDKWCATMAYSLREMPPQGVTLPPNVSVTYAPISSCVMHAGDDPRCWRRQETMRIMEQWRRLTPHVMMYDYNPGFLCGSWLPERDAANFARNIALYKKIGIKGFNAEGRKAFMQTWISYYLRAKLLWDAEADVGALKQDFYTTFFGPAAGPHVQAWWDACEEQLAKGPGHFHEDWLINHLYTVPFTREIHQHVEAARRANLTDVQKGRVEAFALIADHLEAYAAMEAADAALDYPAAAAAAGRMLEDLRKLESISPFLFTVNEQGMLTHFFAGGRQKKYQELAAKTGGAMGQLVAALPPAMKFTRDRFNEGVVAEWYRPQFDDRAWGTENTLITWDQQDPPEDDQGHDYNGYGWYRGTFKVPRTFRNKPIKFWCGGAINEAWVWINGAYAGHKPHQIWWLHPHEFELEVTDLVKPGRNTIAIRVWNDAEIGGLYRRGFFWSPKP